MQTTKSKATKKPILPHTTGWKEKFWHWLGFTNQPTIKLYPGYGHAEHLIMYGHALSFAPLPRKKYSKLFPLNLLALIRLFIVRQISHASVQLNWEDTLVNTITDSDGFIKLTWRSETPVAFGWHEIPVALLNNKNEVITPSTGQC